MPRGYNFVKGTLRYLVSIHHQRRIKDDIWPKDELCPFHRRDKTGDKRNQYPPTHFLRLEDHIVLGLWYRFNSVKKPKRCRFNENQRIKYPTRKIGRGYKRTFNSRLSGLMKRSEFVPVDEVNNHNP